MIPKFGMALDHFTMFLPVTKAPEAHHEKSRTMIQAIGVYSRLRGLFGNRFTTTIYSEMVAKFLDSLVVAYFTGITIRQTALGDGKTLGEAVDEHCQFVMKRLGVQSVTNLTSIMIDEVMAFLLVCSKCGRKTLPANTRTQNQAKHTKLLRVLWKTEAAQITSLNGMMEAHMATQGGRTAAKMVEDHKKKTEKDKLKRAGMVLYRPRKRRRG